MRRKTHQCSLWPSSSSPEALHPGRGPLPQAAHQPAAQAYVHTHTHDHIDEHAHQGARACVRRVRAMRGEERAAATQQRSKCTGAGEFRVFGAHHRAPRQGVPTRVCAPKWTSMTPNDEACSSNRRAAHPLQLLGEHLSCDLPRCRDHDQKDQAGEIMIFGRGSRGPPPRKNGAAGETFG
jgi:hypothetical protein